MEEYMRSILKIVFISMFFMFSVFAMGLDSESTTDLTQKPCQVCDEVKGLTGNNKPYPVIAKDADDGSEALIEMESSMQ